MSVFARSNLKGMMMKQPTEPCDCANCVGRDEHRAAVEAAFKEGRTLLLEGIPITTSWENSESRRKLNERKEPNDTKREG
jgi:hypothetical protein